MSISKEMLAFRAKFSLSQEKSARMAGITLQTWCNVEKGHQNPSALTKAKIYRAIGKEENESVNQQDKSV